MRINLQLHNAKTGELEIAESLTAEKPAQILAAVAQYERFLQLAPSDWDRGVGNNRLALLYLQRGDLERAEFFARREAKLKQYRGAFLLAVTRGEFQAAENLLRKRSGDFSALKSVAGKIQVAYLQGSYDLKAGRSDEAIEQFKQVAQAPTVLWNNNGLQTMDCLANTYLELGRFDEAINEYERILRLNPNYPLTLARFHLAQAYQRTGQLTEACENYRQFLQIWKDADANIPEVVIAKKYIISNL